MAMEMQIIKPGPDKHWPQVQWNNEELKQEITEVMADYQNLVVTPETKAENKALRAKFNKLRTSIETERKSIKKRIEEPYKIFEAQVKEVLVPIDSAIANLDKQLKEIEQSEKQKKREVLQSNFDSLTHPAWLTLDMIWNEKWLNASVAINAAMDEIVKIIRQTRDNAQTLETMPDFGHEAAERYKKTLDFNGAVAQAKESWEIQKRKEQAQAEKDLPANPQNVAQEQQTVNDAQNMPVEPPKAEQPKIYTFKFEVQLTAAQAKMLGDFCRAQNIKLTRIQ